MAQNKSKSILDLAVVAANLGANVAEAESALSDPLVARALEMTTNRSLEDLASNPHALTGVLNTAKGKYFELLVEQKMNAGEAFGDLVLKSGQHAQLADSMNQPGWDIAVLDQNNQVADVIQLKATASRAYIADALNRYPEIKILSTSEATGIDPTHSMVIDSGISNHSVEHFVGHAIDYGASGSISFVDAFNPLFPLIFIAATEGYKVVLGKKGVEDAIRASANRASKSMTGLVVGSMFQAMGFGWFSIVPAVIAARAGPGEIKNALENIGKQLRETYEREKSEELATREERNQYEAVEHSVALQRVGSSRVVSADDIQKMRPFSSGIANVDDFGLACARVIDIYPDQRAKAYERQRLRTEAKRACYEADAKARTEREAEERGRRLMAMSPESRSKQEVIDEVTKRHALALASNDKFKQPSVSDVLNLVLAERGIAKKD